MPILFCNIGWMEKYCGTSDEIPERGGAYNQHSIGHEACNFINNNGIVYGYVQPVGDTIKIEKIGAKKQDKKIENVTVVWTAGPPSGGTVVIGWYENATVYRTFQKIIDPTKSQIESGVTKYIIQGSWDKTVLLPLEKRVIMIPRSVKGGIGQSNVWFAESPESQELVDIVKSHINGEIIRLPDVDHDFSTQEGNPRLIAHLIRERNPAIVKAKKNLILKEKGKLCCEVCDFDFNKTYGKIGEGFCEVHHLHPLSKADGIVKTELKDLAIICSNCHRIIHKMEPMPTLIQLSNMLNR